MAEILITKPGALNQRDRKVLRDAGVVVVEAESPSDVKLIAASGAEVSAGNMLFAALKALSGGGYTYEARAVFTDALVKGMELARVEPSQ
jgi:hypothetical protein